MHRLALILTGVTFVLALCATPPLQAEEQQRSRRPPRAGTAQKQGAPEANGSSQGGSRRAVPRWSPAARAGAESRGGEAPTVRRAVPRRALPSTNASRPQTQGSTRGRAVPRVRSPRDERPAAREDGRHDGRRISGTLRPDRTRRGITRRPSNDLLITGRAVPRVRSRLVSRPLAIQGHRTRYVPRYGLGYGTRRRFGVHIALPRYRVPRIYGNYFYFAGYNTFGVGFGVGSPYYYPYGRAYPPYGYRSYGYPGYPYGYGVGYLSAGEVRLKVKPRHAQVFVDGYFVGSVDNFDGVFQSLRLEEGTHRIEIQAYGYETLVIDVRILPGEKITYEGELLPFP